MYAVPLRISLKGPCNGGQPRPPTCHEGVQPPCSRVHFAAVTQKALTADDAFSLMSDGADTSPDPRML